MSSSRILLLALATPLLQGLSAAPGFYTIGSIDGRGAREWNTNGILDNHGQGHGAHFDMSSSLFLTDTLQTPGSIILKEDGTFTARWSHKIELNYNYQPGFYQPADVWNDPEGTIRFDFDEHYFWWLDFGVYSSANNPNPVNKLMATLNTEATGTWSGSGTLNLTFDCLVDSTSTVTYLPPKSTETMTEVIPGLDLPVSFSTNGTCDGSSISFSWNALEVWLPALRDAYYTGDKEVVVEDALRDGLIALEGKNTADYVNQEVKAWGYEETEIQGAPLGDGELRAKYTQYCLLDVDAPYGFDVLGDYGTAPGLQEARFLYGSESVTRSIESGYAEDGLLSYGDAASLVDVEILSDGIPAETLSLPLIKVPVSPWAGSASDFTASPGVAYTRDPLDWPIALAATDTLSDISFLTGLWGITASANSAFGVTAYSDGTPVNGALVTQIEFTTPKRTEFLTLSGLHTTTLGTDGLTANGDFNTTPVTARLTQHVSLFDLIPGAGAALGKFGRILSGGVGLTIEGKLTGKASGSYAALPSDANPRFTSGTLTANADLKATLNTVPRFARGIVNLSIAGGGGIVMVIDLAPSPNVSSLQAYANFGLKIKFFKLIDGEFETDLGNPPPSPMNSQPMSGSLPAAVNAAATNEIPAQGDVDLVRTGQRALVINSDDHSTLPAPASELTIHRFNPSLDQWEPTLIPDSSGNSNIASNVVPATLNSNLAFFGFPNISNGLIVWSQADGTAPTSSADYATYMNSTDLMFRYFSHGSTLTVETSERMLTDNALADFGPELILGADDGQARLFWVRGDDLDLTGQTTPLQILTRNWIAYDPGVTVTDPSTAFTPETVALSSLSNILDWRVTAWDNDNAAIACVVDTDGESSTETDREIYLVRQSAGSWAAPLRVTNNALSDDCPVLLYEAADRLVLSWRQNGQVVGAMDVDASSVPTIWFDANSRAPLTWHLAQLLYRSGADSLVALWPEDTGIGYTEEALGTLLPATAFPASCYHELGGVVSNVEAAFSRTISTKLEVVAVVENATTANINTVPTTLPATIEQFDIRLDQPCVDPLSFVSTSISDPALPMGGSVVLSVEVSSVDPVTYTWLFNGQVIANETLPTLTLPSLDFDDDGFYTVTASDGTGTVSHTFTVNSTEPFADWMARRFPSETILIGKDDDLDEDGSSNEAEYLFDTHPGDPEDSPDPLIDVRTRSDSAVVDFLLNGKAIDCPYYIEYSSDLSTWHDATALFSPFNTIPGITRLTFQAPTSPLSSFAWGLWNIGAEPASNGFYQLRLLDTP